MQALLYTPEENELRLHLRRVLEQAVPADLRERMLSGERPDSHDKRRWGRIQHEIGYGGYAWPVEFGGHGFNRIQRLIYEQEAARAGAPEMVPWGDRMVAPVLMAFGTPAQRQRFLPRIASMEDYWVQGYSEPQAGSDLASLRMAARRDEDHYIVDGQKIWTTEAQNADWIFCLVRTERTERPHQGISFLLIDMKTPGISVRPIITFDGYHEVNEVWFDRVHVPAENLVGEEGQGWAYAKYLLVEERSAFGSVGFAQREFQRVRELLDQHPDHSHRERVQDLEARFLGLECLLLRFLRARDGDAQPDYVAPHVKILSSELQQDVAELAADVWLEDHPAAPENCAHPMRHFFNMRKSSIFAGTNEIQRNIAANSLLGKEQKHG